MTTREEFETMLNSLVRMSFPYQADFDPAALLAAYDAQAARIAELEAALRAVLPWLLHEIEYPGDPVEKVANGVRALLDRKEA